MNEDFYRLLESRAPVVLHQEGADASLKSAASKAAILPFVREESGWLVAVMQPKATKPELGSPPWQLCKGTRMLQERGKWRDMRPGEEAAIASGVAKAEALAVTALREGEEEIGLIANEIATLYDIGSAQFSSASTGKTKRLWLFAAEMKDRESALLPMRQVARTTAARLWCTQKHFAAKGRADHLPIVENALTLLHAHYKD